MNFCFPRIYCSTLFTARIHLLPVVFISEWSDSCVTHTYIWLRMNVPVQGVSHRHCDLYGSAALQAFPTQRCSPAPTLTEGASIRYEHLGPQCTELGQPSGRSTSDHVMWYVGIYLSDGRAHAHKIHRNLRSNRTASRCLRVLPVRRRRRRLWRLIRSCSLSSHRWCQSMAPLRSPPRCYSFWPVLQQAEDPA